MFAIMILILMLAIFGPIFKGIFVIGLVFFIGSIILVLSLMIPTIGTHINRYKILKDTKEQLDIFTSKEVLETLKKEDKKKLAELIDLYINGKNISKHKLLSDLYYTGLGYTIADLGFTKTVRYGVGYAMLRKIVRGKKNKIIDSIFEGKE